jgi:ATP-binding cassette, subfamily B, bacterial
LRLLRDQRSVLRSHGWLRSPALIGTLAMIAMLPRVSRVRTILLAIGTIVVAALPVGVTVVGGETVGAIPDVLRDGIASASGARLTNLVIVLGILVTLARIVGPLHRALGYTFAREVDRHVQERVLSVVVAPIGISHLEDPATLDEIRNALGVDPVGQHPGDVVRALASLLPSWLRALGSALLLVTFHWWLGALWLALWPGMLTIIQREVVVDRGCVVEVGDHQRLLAAGGLYAEMFELQAGAYR